MSLNPSNQGRTSGLSLAGLCAGFDEPVQQAQQVFREVLTALSEPGRLHRLPQREAPPGLHPAAYQVCLALLDQETPLWVAPALQSSAILSALRFHCGCPLVEDPAKAVFALTNAEEAGDLARFAQGSHEYPDRSTTVIVQVDGLESGGDWRLRGPGIDGERAVTIAGLEQGWLDPLSRNRARFPCGVDLLFTAGGTLMGLPRTTEVEV